VSSQLGLLLLTLLFDRWIGVPGFFNNIGTKRTAAVAMVKLILR
jgi:hypothetical protein